MPPLAFKYKDIAQSTLQLNNFRIGWCLTQKLVDHVETSTKSLNEGAAHEQQRWVAPPRNPDKVCQGGGRGFPKRVLSPDQGVT